MAIAKRQKLGEVLVSNNIISKIQLDEAIIEQKKSKKRLGQVIIDLGIATDVDIAKTLARQLDFSYIDLDKLIIDPKIIEMIPETKARYHKVIPVSRDESKLILAMFDPLNFIAIDEIASLTKYEILPALCTESALLKAINRHYNVLDNLEEALKTKKGDKLLPVAAGEEEKILTVEGQVDQTPVVRLVNLILIQAVRDRASDIHVEPDADQLRIRTRIDGILYEIMTPPKSLHQGVVSRLKVMAELDIARKQSPQDGRFMINVNNQDFDIRVSTLPTLFGEKIVLRLLEKSRSLLNLSEIGFTSESLQAFKKLIKRPYGLILLTGPTGCGKTTTIYSALSEINSLEKNIVTVEDPIEYQLKLINQVQVNEKAGITFATGLRSILRQDPDIIMVGEIRDSETANIAIHAALTGHLVLSTLHTNDAAGAVARLVDMGIEPFLVASSILAVIAQRLVRKICPECKTMYVPSQEILEDIGIPAENPPQLFKGSGCGTCRMTGYYGRIGAFEILEINEKLRNLIVSNASSSTMRNLAISQGFKTLRNVGLNKVLTGVTTIEEVLRVTQDVE